MSDYGHVYELLYDIAAEYNWVTSENKDEGTFVVSVKGDWQTFDVEIIYNENAEHLYVYATFRVPVAKEHLPDMYELVNYINLGGWFGFFTYTSETELVAWRYAHSFVETDPENVLLLDQILHQANGNLDSYYPAFQLVARGGVKAVDAIKQIVVCQDRRKS